MIFVYLIPDIYLNIYGNVLDTDILLPQYIVNTLPVVQCLKLIRPRARLARPRVGVTVSGLGRIGLARKIYETTENYSLALGPGVLLYDTEPD